MREGSIQRLVLVLILALLLAGCMDDEITVRDVGKNDVGTSIGRIRKDDIDGRPEVGGHLQGNWSGEHWTAQP